MEFPLKGKSLVIVGGSSGLGRSAALACARAGARVVVVGRDPAKIEAVGRELGDAGRGLAGDARDPATAARAVELACAAFGAFDGLYHVAGGSGRAAGDGPLHALSDEGWRGTQAHNLESVFLSNRAAARKLLELGRGGSILNLGSVLGEFPAPRHFATHAYAAAKAGIVGLTRACAACYAPQGIRFNVVAPAVVATPMAARAQRDEEILAYLGTKQPLEGGRIGQPEHLDGAVLYLLSDAARWVTGQVLYVDGGWSVSEGQHRGAPP